MTALAKTTTPAATKLDEGQKLRPRYLESLNLVERLHRQLLDVIKDELDRRGERVVLAEEGVGRRDRGLGRAQPEVHVAEVDEPAHLARQRARLAQDHVVVVGVAVDHLARQPRQRASPRPAAG